MTYDQEISMIMAHLPAMADRTWSVRTVRSYAEYKEAFRPIHDLTARIMQDL
jgi:hypothetical protein